jgi:hypothetical protein
MKALQENQRLLTEATNALVARINELDARVEPLKRTSVDQGLSHIGARFAALERRLTALETRLGLRPF